MSLSVFFSLNINLHTVLFYFQLELFADSIHSQGLVRRITVYRDEAQTVVDECREIFKNRRDKLDLVYNYLIYMCFWAHFCSFLFLTPSPRAPPLFLLCI